VKRSRYTKEADCLRPEAGRTGHTHSGRVLEIRRTGHFELRRMTQLEEEKQCLTRVVANLSLDRPMLQDVLSKKI